MQIGKTISVDFADMAATTELNLLTADITANGILATGSCFAPAKSGNTVTISPGSVVFPGGIKFSLRESVSLEVTQNCVIYASYSTVINSGGIYVGTARPSGSIPIAKVEDGVLFDERVFSDYNIARPSGNLYVDGTISLVQKRLSKEMGWVEVSSYMMPGDYRALIVPAIATFAPNGMHVKSYRFLGLPDGADSDVYPFTCACENNSGSSYYGLDIDGKVHREGRLLTFFVRTSKTETRTHKYLPLPANDFKML